MDDDDPVVVVRAVYAAIERADHHDVDERLAADLRWQQAARAVPASGSALRRPADVIDRVLRPFERDWDGFTEELRQVTELGPTVVVEGTYRGRYRPTGKELSAEFCHLWTVRDGRVSEFRQYTDTAAFREVTGEA